jgi:hypothetical protein
VDVKQGDWSAASTLSDTQGPRGREIDDYLVALRQRCAARNGEPVDLEWEELSQLLHQSAASALLVNVLLESHGDVNFRLELPEEEPALDLALRAGLAFALANRHGKVEIEGPEEASILLRSPTWRRSWTPATRPAWVQLLGPSPDGLGPPALGNGNGNGNGHSEVPDFNHLFGDGRAMFINPHRSRRSGSAESVFPLVSRWLNHTAKDLRHEEEPDEKAAVWLSDLLNSVRILLDELIQNVRGHATDRRSDPVFSLVKVEIDNEEERPAVAITVQDTGPGIVSTLKPKLRGERADTDLMVELFEGELPLWQSARGIGLPKVWKTCLKMEAELTVATGRLRLSGLAGSEPSCDEGEFDSPGVVVAVRLPLLPAG